jgi:alanine racemase
VSIDERLAMAGLPPLPRRCWLEIDLEALEGNLAVVSELAGAGVEINAVVKADAYGHGIEAVARTLAAAGAARLCVASLDEALHLRATGITAPLLVLFSVPPSCAAEAVAHGIELVAADEATTLATLDAWRAAGGDGLAIHLEVETGLSRAGLPPGRVVGLARRIVGTPGARLAGLWSHIATPESTEATAAQVDAFDRATAALAAAELGVPARHLAATGALFSGRAPSFDGVRPGLCLYGIVPDDLPLSAAGRAAATQLRPAMALKCHALRVEKLAPGTPVGYGGTWTTPRRSLIATLPVGYGDGWYRSSAPGAQAIVRGRRVPLVGTVAMDAVMADVTDVAGVDLDDEFVLLGRQGEEQITAGELARHRGTIAWEVVTAMSQRLPRVYHAGSEPIGVRTLAGEIWRQAGTE